jgi:hypothetical protein
VREQLLPTLAPKLQQQVVLGRGVVESGKVNKIKDAT